MLRFMVPVVVLTGFLGSGKTTLLNHIFRARPPSPRKIAIIVNELGQIGIDGTLLPGGITRQVEISGGCICCALDEDLEKTLSDLVASEPALEMIFIETTGIAEPLPISWTLAKKPLDAIVHLRCVVTVVDATTHEDNRRQGPTADAQVENADVLVVSKADLVDRAALLALEARLRDACPEAPLIGGGPARAAATLWQMFDDPDLTPRERPVMDAAAHRHGHGIDSVSLAISETLDFEVLQGELEDLGPGYVRIKGIARVIDESTGSRAPRVVAFHRVGARVSVEVLDRSPAESLDGCIVALGTEISEADLARCVRDAVIP